MGRKRDRKGQACSVDIPGMGLTDGRKREAKHYGAMVAALAADLGGEDRLTTAQMELVRRAAGLSLLASMGEAALINGDDVDVEQLVAVGKAQRFILTSLGLERVEKEVQTLEGYLDAEVAD